MDARIIFFFCLPTMFNYLEEKEDSRIFGKAEVVAHLRKKRFENVRARTHIGKVREAGFFFRIKEFWWESGAGSSGRKGW